MSRHRRRGRRSTAVQARTLSVPHSCTGRRPSSRRLSSCRRRRRLGPKHRTSRARGCCTSSPRSSRPGTRSCCTPLPCSCRRVGRTRTLDRRCRRRSRWSPVRTHRRCSIRSGTTSDCTCTSRTRTPGPSGRQAPLRTRSLRWRRSRRSWPDRSRCTRTLRRCIAVRAGRAHRRRTRAPADCNSDCRLRTKGQVGTRRPRRTRCFRS
jgi:hypothetical protein